jgi:hypothetical protein
MSSTYAATFPGDSLSLDWGPARLDPDHPLHPGGLDLRDEAGERPDDN